MSESNSRTPARIGRIRLKAQAATWLNDPMRLLLGRDIQPQDEVLARRGGRAALPLFLDLERDAQVAAVLQKRRMALVGREWRVDPGEDTPAGRDAAELVTQALRALPFDQAVNDLLGALLLGVSVAEVVWGEAGTLLLPQRLVCHHPGRFGFRATEEGEVEGRLLTRAAPQEGEALDARKWVFHRSGSRFGDPWGNGLGGRLWWPVFFKRQGIGFWMGALEKFGQPTAVGKYPQGTSDADQDRLLAALGAIASDTGVAIPDGMTVELLEAKRAGSFDSYASLCRYFDEEISKVVLGETLTSAGGDSGSRALGQVHNQVRLEITKGDGDALANTLNATLVRWIVEVNRPGAAPPLPRLWWVVEEAEDLSARAKRDVDIASLGFAPTPDYITATYGEGWQPKPAPAPALPPAAERPSATQAAPPAAAFALAMPAAPEDAIAAQLEEALRPVLAEWLERLAGVVEGASSLGEVADGLLRLYPELPASALAPAIQQAMQLAHLTGRSELLDDGP